jgi:hypothetical protein
MINKTVEQAVSQRKEQVLREADRKKRLSELQSFKENLV